MLWRHKPIENILNENLCELNHLFLITVFVNLQINISQNKIGRSFASSNDVLYSVSSQINPNLIEVYMNSTKFCSV